MNKRTQILLAILLSISLLTFSLGTFILLTRGSLQPSSFLIICFEVVKNVQEHIHINPQGMIGTFIVATISISMFLVLLRFIIFLISYRQLNTQKSTAIENYKSKLDKLLVKHDIQQDVIRILESDKLTAYTFGIFRPKIIISNLLLEKLTTEQLEAVILHELSHIKNKHTLMLITTQTISSFLFFIPIVKYLYTQLKVEFEITADAYVESIQKTNTYLRQAIVLKLEYKKNSFTYFSSSPIETRVEYLINKRFSLERIGFWQLSLSIVSLLLMLGMATNNPKQVFAQHPAQENSVCKSATTCYPSDCPENSLVQQDTFTIFIPASFQTLYSR